LLIAFADSALLLAALGIHSILVGYFVVSRRKEIGVRMAVGASRFQIYRLAASSAGKPVFIGIALGLSSAIHGSRLIEKLLYGVRALDTLVVASTIGILIIVSAFFSAFSPLIERLQLTLLRCSVSIDASDPEWLRLASKQITASAWNFGPNCSIGVTYLGTPQPQSQLSSPALEFRWASLW
jgi:hypothetical protein